MKLKLAYGKELPLPRNLNFTERIKYIEDNLLNNKENIFEEEITYTDKQGKQRKKIISVTYEEFYNVLSPNISNKKKMKQLKDRWLGVKREGLPYPNDLVKLNIDYLSSYLLFAKDFSVKPEIRRFKELKRIELNKRKNRVLTTDEEKELDKLCKKVLYFKLKPKNSNRNDVVLYENKKYEKFIKHRIKNIVEDSSLKERLVKQNKKIKEIKQEVELKQQEIHDIHNEIKLLKSELKELYEKLKVDKKNVKLLKKIKEKTKKIRLLKGDLSYLESSIEWLVDDYYFITDLKVI
ncbi:hypothetical protein [Bacillus smithii]|uniref:hypothetical protein n=1 Tax=Bacillus smithii TaxID=1479 RepID=UPI002E2411F2|nr:hypothetical protein [Bacillus smithii]MED4928963.1 hypothetical protein [Bacillus smithii]